MGTNQCTRILEKLDLMDVNNNSNPNHPCRPLLIILARDIYPPSMLAHVPVLAQRYNIPLLLLPGRSSIELGHVMNVRKTSILLFLPRRIAMSTTRTKSKEEHGGGGLDPTGNGMTVEIDTNKQHNDNIGWINQPKK